MRVGLVVAVMIALLAIGGATLLARPVPRPTSVATPTSAPFVTADPAVTSRVDPAMERGRLADDDRVVRGRLLVRGLIVPIDGATVPTDPSLLPNAPRDFRAGWHEGDRLPRGRAHTGARGRSGYGHPGGS